ncbi:BTAD domain-containing putative transcriptional regulator [Kitasatospora purpeofusca]|uniref:AfsR/SARP family transcriptional regulator n=1 Tax=Kitasatospora purpeofusca TaxID=67352 RepID=UPI0036D23D07
MRYEIMGGLRVCDGEAVSVVSARKMETLLAVLLIRAGQVVTVSQFTAELWGDTPPRRATAALHVYISQLRKFLDRPGRTENPIATRSPGYLLRLGHDTLDVHEFQQLMTRGRAAMKRDRYEEASAVLDGALALWRSPVLSELRLGPIVNSFAAWAEEARLECIEMRMDADLALGSHRELVSELYSLTAEHPLREAFHRQLMLALYRSERQSDALRAYANARETLNDELGIEPGRVLRDLQRSILLDDGRLDLARAS